MKKNLLSLLTLLTTGVIYAQVGINSSLPNATLDIVGKGSEATTKDGVIPPKVTKQNLASKNTGTYNASQTGAIVYVIDASLPTGTTPSLSQTSNINAVGYYFFDGSIWQKLSSTAGGDDSKDAWVDNITNTRVELSTTSTGTARASGTNISFQDNGRLNMGANGSADAGIHLVGDGEGWKDDIRLDSFSGTATANPGPNFRMYASRGTQAAPVNLATDNSLGQIAFHGRIGNDFPAAARIWADYKGNGTTNLSNLSLSVNGYGNPSLVINSNQHVGIGTSSPNATLDIRKKTTDATSSKDGIIPPILTKSELANKVAGTYGSSQTGAIVYINDVTDPTDTAASETQVTNVLSKGYYSFDGTKWNPLYDSSNIAIPIRYGTMTTSPINISPISTTSTALKSYIELPPGKWLVTTNILLYANNTLRNATNQPWFWTRFSFNGETTAALAQTSTTKTTDFIGSSLVSGVFTSPPTPASQGQRPTYVYSMVSGQVIIENKTSNNKFYGLLWTGSESNISSNPNGYEFINLSSSSNGENVITAMKIQ